MTDDVTLVERLQNIRLPWENESLSSLCQKAAARIIALEAENAALRSELEGVLNSVAGLPEALASSERKLADLRAHASWLGLKEAAELLKDHLNSYKGGSLGHLALFLAAQDLRSLAAERQAALARAPETEPK